MNPARIATVILASVILACAVTAEAQVINPTRVEWDAPDHALTSRYEVGYYLGGASSPVQTVSVPVSATAPVGAGYGTALPRPVLGAFVVRLRACGAAAGGGEVCSEWSAESGPFALSPRLPAAPRVVP